MTLVYKLRKLLGMPDIYTIGGSTEYRFKNDEGHEIFKNKDLLFYCDVEEMVSCCGIILIHNFQVRTNENNETKNQFKILVTELYERKLFNKQEVLIQVNLTPSSKDNVVIIQALSELPFFQMVREFRNMNSGNLVQVWMSKVRR